MEMNVAQQSGKFLLLFIEHDTAAKIEVYITESMELIMYHLSTVSVLC